MSPLPTRLLAEIRRRKVHRTALLYVLGGLGTVEAAALVFPRLQLPDWTVTLVLALVIAGLPLALALSWAFEIGPEGVTRTGDAGPAEPPLPPSSPDPLASAAAASVATPAAVSRVDRALATALAPGRDRTSILVVPFVNGSSDPDNEYVADGVTDEVITDLSRIGSLRVISRASAMRLKGSSMGGVATARDLGVDYVLEGSVRKARDDLRITVRLVDVNAGEARWSERYRGTFDELFEIQERVARSVAAELPLQVHPEEVGTSREPGMDDPRVLESYLRARHEMFRFSSSGLRRAEQHLRNGLAVTGDRPLLYSALGHVHAFHAQLGLDPDGDHLREAQHCVERVFALEPDSSRGHMLQGQIHLQAGDLRAAREPLERGLEGRPDDPDTLMFLGYLCALMGQHDRALSLFDRLLEIDPLTPINHAMPSFVSVLEGRPEEALDGYRTYLDMDPDSPFACWCWAWVLLRNGRVSEAEAAARPLLQDEAESNFAVLAAAALHAARGERAAVVATVSDELREAARTNELLSRELAHCFAQVGEKKEALDWLDNTIRIGNVNFPFWAKHDTWLENIRSEPRYRELMRQVEREWRSLNPAAAARVSVPGPEASPADAPDPGDPHRVAVLPLANIHPDRDEDYFADGMTEELISVISRIHGLDVIARTSIMAYRDTSKPVREIGRELGVGTVLEGSVRKAGDQLRITVQLIDVRTEGHLWSGDYDREMREIFAVQSDIARSVAGALEVTLLGAERRRVDRPPTENLEAYDLYLLGRHHLNKRTDSGIRQAVEHFGDAVALDPNFAAAHAGLADAYVLAGVGYASIPNAMPRAREAALRAVELDEELADAHTSLGYVALMHEWDWRTAERELARAVELAPSDARAHQWHAHVAISRRRYDEASERVGRARALDPLSVVIQNEAGWPRHYMRDLEGAARCYRRASSMDPSFAMSHYNLGAVFEAQGEHERAIESYRRAVELSDRTPLIVSALAAALARQGATEEARTLLDELEAKTAEGAALWIWHVPVHDALGQHDEALDALESALEGREAGVIYLNTVHYPTSAELKARPRYAAVAEAVREHFGFASTEA